MLTKLFKKFTSCRKFLPLLSVAALVSLAISADTAFAAEDTYQDFLQTWGRILSLIGSLINVILWIVIKFIGDLLTNDFIFGAGIEDMLKSIWQTVRNFVNIAFVFVLLVIAFYNIVSIDPEKIPLKKSLGKVAIALILVNFSYFAAKVVLDVANVLTTAVFAIPRDIITDLQLSSAENEYGDEAIHAQCYKKFYQGAEVDLATMEYDSLPAENGSAWQTDASGSYLLMPTKCHIPNVVKVKLFRDNAELPGESVVSANYDEMKVYLYYQDTPSSELIDVDYDPTKGGTGYESPEEYNSKLEKAELTAKKFGRNTVTMILAKTMFDLNKLTAVSAASSSGFFGLTVSGMVNLLLLVLYGTMFVAMFIVLIFRVVYLWICIAFSPLVALMFVFKDFGIDMPDEANISKLFIKYAFVPVKMGIALSVGVLMLFKANQQSVLQDTVTTLGEKAADIQIPIDTLVNDSSIQKLMWNIATVAVIWIAIKWSLKDLSGPVQGIVDKITGYVGAVGEVAAKIPLTLPIAPYANLEEGGERKMTTIGQVWRSAGATNLNAIVEGMIRGESREAAKLRRSLSDQLDLITVKSSDQARDLANITNNDEYMSHIMIEENKDVRNKLAEKLVLQGALDKESAEFKDWKKNPTAEGFRKLLAGMNPVNRGAYFGDKDVMEAWREVGKSSLAAVTAKNSVLLGGSEVSDEGLWADSGKRGAAQTSINGDLTRLEQINKGARDAVEGALLLEKNDARTKYSAEATQKVVKEAVDALAAASKLEGEARKNAGKDLKGQAKDLFNAAVGKLPAPQASGGATAGGAGAGGGSGTAAGGPR